MQPTEFSVYFALSRCRCTNKPDCHNSCFLVTYFCTEKVIGDHQDGAQNTIDAGSFIDTYGAYLQIQTCLVFASFVKAGSVISDILRIARDDPNHRDAIKDIQKSDGVFYDSVRQIFAICARFCNYFGLQSNFL